MKRLLFGLFLLVVAGCSAGAVVTKAEFDQITPGMSYAEVQGIIGDPGQKLSEGAMMGITTTMYMWQNAGGSNMNAMFQNDKLINKAQMNLP